MNESKYETAIYYILLFFAVILCGAILKISASFSLPVLLSVLLACAFYPVVKRMNQKLKLPWVAGTLLMIFVFVLIIMLLSTIIGKSISSVLSQFTKYESKLYSIYSLIADLLNIKYDADLTLFENVWGLNLVREFVQGTALYFSGNVVSFTKDFGLVLLFCTFFLIEMRHGQAKIRMMFDSKIQGRVIIIATKIVSEIVNYLSIKFLVSLATGILVFLVVYLAGVEFPVMWAFFSFIMNFIPTFGSIFSVGITSVFALIQFYPSGYGVLFVFLAMLIINLVIGNIIEPRIEGENLGLSPFVILVSLSFWGWMWGFVGMVVAVPVMVGVKIVCENISFLHPVAILLGNGPSEKTEKTVKETE